MNSTLVASLMWPRRVAEQRGGRERQHRPQPLAAGGDQVVGHFRNHLHVGAGLGQDQLVDALHIRLG
jgi:hypothetical protein